MLYACPMWWNNTKRQALPLDKVQRKALCLICTAFRTMPTEALEIEASIPPIKHQANLVIRRYALRLNKLPMDSAVIQHLPNSWRDNSPPSFPRPLSTPNRRSKPKTCLQKIANMTSHDHERIDPFATAPWCRSLSLYPNRFLVKPCDTPSDPIVTQEKHLKLIEDFKKDPNALYLV